MPVRHLRALAPDGAARYLELGLEDFLRRCALNFKSLEECLC